MEKNNKIFNRYPLGFKIYLILVFSNYFFQMVFLKQFGNNSIFLFGLDDQTIEILSLETNLQNFSLAKILGQIVGWVIGLFITYKIIKLKNWARITLIIFSIFNLFIYFFKKNRMFDFFNLIKSVDIWPGYIFFSCFIFYSISFSIFIIFYFQKKSVKNLFT